MVYVSGMIALHPGVSAAALCMLHHRELRTDLRRACRGTGRIPAVQKEGLQGSTAAEQAEQALANMQNVLTAAGSSMDKVVKVTVLMVDMGEYAAINGMWEFRRYMLVHSAHSQRYRVCTRAAEVYARYFSESKPARAAFAVKALPAGALVEMDAIALQ